MDTVLGRRKLIHKPTQQLPCQGCYWSGLLVCHLPPKLGALSAVCSLHRSVSAIRHACSDMPVMQINVLVCPDSNNTAILNCCSGGNGL